MPKPGHARLFLQPGFRLRCFGITQAVRQRTPWIVTSCVRIFGVPTIGQFDATRREFVQTFLTIAALFSAAQDAPAVIAGLHS
jgi:hypothetical protein